MVNSQDIKNQLLEAVLPLISEREKILLLHSALSKLGFERGKVYLSGLLDFLQSILERDITVVLPSFTFSFPKRKQYNWKDPSETGVLSDLARNYLNFVRTRNPMFSFSVMGPKTGEFLSTREDSGYGAGTAVERLAAKDVTVVMLGAQWNCCTVIHAVEEKKQVPYREYINWEYQVDFGGGPSILPYQLFVRNSNDNSILRFDRIREELIDSGHLRRTKLNGIYLESANGGEIASISERKIEKNPYFFVEEILNDD